MQYKHIFFPEYKKTTKQTNIALIMVQTLV